MPKLNIDGTVIEVEDGLTIIQACEQAGVEIPRFCYHERLSIAGNCRMCLVEVVGMPKPVASCAMGVNDLRPGRDGAPAEVRTNTPTVMKAREGVLEFLLVNHPLDCPICDQGGECDLQDQTMAFGYDSSRFALNKRAVEEKFIGPLIKTFMTRCIHCTRCVRFMSEYAGIDELGATGRGEDMEITTYLERGTTSELQGNIVDLCPVGALTSRPYAFAARPWELRKTESIDVMDAVGSNIRVDARDREVMRILPRNHDDVNEEWISDKTRFVWDGLKVQRLDRPYVRRGGRLVEATWGEAFETIAEKMKWVAGSRLGIVAGDLATAEEMFALKTLARKLGSPHTDCRQDGARLDPALGRASYLFNTTIAGLESADALLIVGANPRLEASILNTRIRKRWRAGRFPIAVVGERADLTYPYEYLGAGPETLGELAAGDNAFHKILADAERPAIVVGQGALARPDGAAVLSLAAKLAVATGTVNERWNGFNVLHTAAARVAGLDLGFVPGENGLDVAGILDAAETGGLDVVYLLGADEIDMGRLGDAMVVYQGTHGDRGAHRADVILPGAAYTEKDGIYVNTEGRPQATERAVFPPGEARDDWTVLRALSEALGATLPFDTLGQLRAAMFEAAPHLARLDTIEPAEPAPLHDLAGLGGRVSKDPFQSTVDDFHLTNPIARASQTMGRMSALVAGERGKATGTHG